MSFREWGEVMDGKDMWQNWPVRGSWHELVHSARSLTYMCLFRLF
jgi:hypothetical protein